MRHATHDGPNGGRIFFLLRDHMNQEGKRLRHEAAPLLPRFEGTRNATSRLVRIFNAPYFGSVFFTLLVVGIYITTRLLASSYQHGQVKFVEHNDAPRTNEAVESKAVSTEMFSGAKYKTALRLRESAALGMAVSLSVFAAYRATGRPPQTAQEVLSLLADRNLLPPGVTAEGDSLRSASSRVRLNYKASPLSFEVISLPLDENSGPALLFQFPLPTSGANSIMYFQNLQGDTLPAAFCNAEQLTTAGWKISHWRTDDLALDGSSIADFREQNEWIKSLVPRNK